MMQQETFSAARMQALSVTVGLLTFVLVGVASCLALALAAFYLVVSFALLVLQSACEIFNGLAGTWSGASPLLKVIILAVAFYGGYRLYKVRKARCTNA